ncbi:serine/threonine/tyrosine-interacting protein B-like [Macrosteles quadrilineatus]|uniref:serine/threonine/tyrosine-interacting protein B-like n=1 Tax=Macrosteles quadrilineatus TaxID=74068 RepID=UPI0023E0FCEC|nr:serine/threonine/tyrosine-interacting protein B-like [Macrosteles quadrilineatus]
MISYPYYNYKSMLSDEPMMGHNEEVNNDTLQNLKFACGWTDWTYTMRRSMQEVVPGLFLGPYSAAQKTKLNDLKENGITHIICVRQDIEAHFIKPNFPGHFQYLTLNIADCVTENIIRYFKTVKSFIDQSLASGGKVLIHGNGGISRSAALAIAYIMQKYSLNIKDAFTLVQQNRFCINPNEGFMAQLAEFEPIYRAQQQTVELGQRSGGSSCNKRSLDR